MGFRKFDNGNERPPTTRRQDYNIPCLNQNINIKLIAGKLKDDYYRKITLTNKVIMLNNFSGESF